MRQRCSASDHAHRDRHQAPAACTIRCGPRCPGIGEQLLRDAARLPSASTSRLDCTSGCSRPTRPACASTRGSAAASSTPAARTLPLPATRAFCRCIGRIWPSWPDFNRVDGQHVQLVARAKHHRPSVSLAQRAEHRQHARIRMRILSAWSPLRWRRAPCPPLNDPANDLADAQHMRYCANTKI